MVQPKLALVLPARQHSTLTSTILRSTTTTATHVSLTASPTMSSSTPSPSAQRKQQELQNTYSNYKSTMQQLAQRIGEVEQDVEEHKLVIDSLKPVSEDRRCFRMINGVLTERKAGEVLPALTTNVDGLKKVLDGLVKEYKRVQDEMDAWKAKNNVQVVSQ
ncbi:putative prefoldin subunit 2 [Drechslerella dactyloides]|uniref:Prefoldin subunit 2 n=1 Tax=Drechslerella dactyloides TaxID=74499 RepID=A0AAD6NMX9_DREDA|nr:putative prefoldin subunit 2 [Drechslerella dactyloides]